MRHDCCCFGIIFLSIVFQVKATTGTDDFTISFFITYRTWRRYAVSAHNSRNKESVLVGHPPGEIPNSSYINLFFMYNNVGRVYIYIYAVTLPPLP